MKLDSSIIVFLVLFASCAERTPAPSETEEDPPPSPAFTVIHGNIQGIITALQSPYQVTGNLIVDSSASLLIEAGVKLYFEDSTQMIVRGRLDCAGTMSAPILFSSFRNTWKGIQITNSSSMSILEFAILENADVTTDSTFSRNSAFEVVGASVTIKNSIFKNNRSINGGAIHFEQAQSLITNNIITNNLALTFGGAAVSSNSSCNFVNNTFFNNSSVNYGGALVLISPVFDLVQNNIFFMNTGQTGDPRIAILQADSSNFVLQYNFLQSGTLNPLFTSQTDFHLTPLSPCINAGNPAVQFNDPNGSRNDQGAYGGPFGGW